MNHLNITRAFASLSLATALLYPAHLVLAADATRPGPDVPAPAVTAAPDAPDGYAAFTPRYLKVKPGVNLLRPTRESYAVGGTLQVAVGPARPGAIDDTKLPAYFAGVETKQQALELCELLIWGTHLECEKDFASLVWLYRIFGYDHSAPQPAAGDRKFGDHVSESESGGFDVSLTLFRLGTGMGAQAQVGRFTLHVNADASVTWDKADIYLTGPLLNWQSTKGNETDAQITQRIAAEKAVETNRNRLIDEVFTRFARPTVLAAAATHPRREVVGPVPVRAATNAPPQPTQP